MCSKQSLKDTESKDSGSEYDPDETTDEYEEVTKGSSEAFVDPTRRELFIKSLKSHRNGIPCEQERQALELFFRIQKGVLRSEIEGTLK